MGRGPCRRRSPRHREAARIQALRYVTTWPLLQAPEVAPARLVPGREQPPARAEPPEALGRFRGALVEDADQLSAELGEVAGDASLARAGELHVRDDPEAALDGELVEHLRLPAPGRDHPAGVLLAPVAALAHPLDLRHELGRADGHVHVRPAGAVLLPDLQVGNPRRHGGAPQPPREPVAEPLPAAPGDPVGVPAALVAARVEGEGEQDPRARVAGAALQGLQNPRVVAPGHVVAALRTAPRAAAKAPGGHVPGLPVYQDHRPGAQHARPDALGRVAGDALQRVRLEGGLEAGPLQGRPEPLPLVRARWGSRGPHSHR